MSALSVFIIFFLCLIIAIPISIGLGIVSVLPGIFDSSFTASGQFVIRSMLGGIDSFPLLAVPMFVLSGMVMAKGGISKKIFDVFVYFIGKFTAGMPCAVIVTCLFYGAISGSAPATVAAVGSMTIPILIKLGYDKNLPQRSLRFQEDWVSLSLQVFLLLCTEWHPDSLSVTCLSPGFFPGFLSVCC